MSNTIITLKDVVKTIASGGRPKGGAVESGIFSIGAEHLDGLGGFNLKKGKYIPFEYYNTIGKGKIQTDDILIVKDGATTGKVSYVDNEFPLENAAINEHVFRLQLDEKRIFPKFCFHYLFSDSGYKAIMSDFRGATVGGISKGFINSIKISLPPLSIQKRIAKILDKADALRKKNRQLLQYYDDLAQSLFIDMFGDPVRNEKGWEIKKLGELSTKILSGNTPIGGSNVYVGNGIAFFRSQNVWKNELIYDDIAYIDSATHAKMKNTSLMNLDILITKTGRINTENSSLGRAALFVGKDNNANINGHVYLIRLNKGNSHGFILKILTSVEYREHIRNVCVGGIDKRQLNKEHIQDFPIIYPPVELQKQFATQIQNIEQQKEKLKTQMQESENLFQALLQKAFNGGLN